MEQERDNYVYYTLSCLPSDICTRYKCSIYNKYIFLLFFILLQHMSMLIFGTKPNDQMMDVVFLQAKAPTVICMHFVLVSPISIKVKNNYLSIMIY